MKCDYLDSPRKPRFTKRTSVTKRTDVTIPLGQIGGGLVRFTQQDKV